MAIQTYNVPSDRIQHKTKVDFTQRCVQKVIHVVQYDKSLPVIAVELFLNGEPYTLSTHADVKVRWGKRDHTFIYKDALGCDSARHVVYFDVDDQMAFLPGPVNPIIELVVSGNKAGSSSIPFEIDRNPIQEGDLESSSEYVDLDKAVQEAKDARDEIIAMGEDLYTKEEVDQKVQDVEDAVNQKVENIEALIPAQAAPNNELADKSFVNSSLNSIAAFYITKNAEGAAFENYAELMAATTFYSGGEERTPTRNDYAIVRADENQDNATTRYIYQNEWQFQYVVNETALTSEQLAAINSGITASLVAKLTGINMDSKVDKVTAAASMARIYGIHIDGNQRLFNVDLGTNANTVAYRGDGGRLKVGDPIADGDAATKKYVDDKAPVLTQLPDGSYSLKI